jgi:hypothetical protein
LKFIADENVMALREDSQITTDDAIQTNLLFIHIYYWGKEE